MTPRIKKLILDFQRYKNIDALLVTNDTNIRYLTGYKSSESWLLVHKSRAYFITDFRYTLQAKAALKGVSVKQFTQSAYVTLFDLAKILKIKRLGFDERQTTVAQFKKLKETCWRRTKLVAANAVVESLREIKDVSEIQTIKECLKVHQKALNYIGKVVRPGVSEAFLLRKLEDFVKSHKVGFSFSPIIASGPNSCFPHAQVTDRILKNNEPVLIDFGIDINGYKSDLTRNFFLGRISPRVKEVFEATRLAQKEAISVIKPGISVADADLKARNVLRKFGLAKYFGHSLGHGVGLDIHEGPRLSHKCSCLLEPGMVVTVEPGVYIPNAFGIRVEDMILVTDKGCEVLSGNID